MKPLRQRICEEVYKKHSPVTVRFLMDHKGDEYYEAECFRCGKVWLMQEKELDEFLKDYASRGFTEEDRDIETPEGEGEDRQG